jgi:hypothetical protein
MQERRYEVYNMNHLKGESLNVGFDRGINLEFHGAKVTSDGGLLARCINPVSNSHILKGGLS